MSMPAPPLGLCSWHLEHSDMRVPAVTTFEGTALCEACNSRAYAEEGEGGADATFDALQDVAERQAGAMLDWIRARAALAAPDEPGRTQAPASAGGADEAPADR